jgi:hypothetical protein
VRLGKTANSSDAPQRVQSSTESCSALVSPLSVRNEPAGHGLHEYEPADEYSPAGQTWQLPLPSAKVPAWQSLQSSGLSWEVMAPSSAMAKPAGQVEHVLEAVFEAYESAAHTEHGPASAEKVPAAQRPQETQDPSPYTSALALVPSEPGPHEHSRGPPSL